MIDLDEVRQVAAGAPETPLAHDDDGVLADVVEDDVELWRSMKGWCLLLADEAEAGRRDAEELVGLRDVEKEVRRLRRALVRYASHDAGCPCMKGGKCNCGLFEELRGGGREIPSDVPDRAAPGRARRITGP